MNNWPNQPPPDFYPPEAPAYAPPQQQQRPQPQPQQQQAFRQQQAEQIVRVASQMSDAQMKELILQDSQWALNMPRIKRLKDQYSSVDITTFINFLMMAQKKGADPESNEIYLIGYNSSEGFGEHKKWIMKYSTVFSYHWYMAKAINSGLVEEAIGTETAVIDYFDHRKGTIVKTLCTKAWVKRKGVEKPFIYYARLPEFAKTSSKDGSYIGQWASKTYLMLEKCAIACVLRMAFPDVFAGMYVAEEMADSPIPDDENFGTEIVLSESTGAKSLFDSAPPQKKGVAEVTQQFAKEH